jgi:hypothetical protein
VVIKSAPTFEKLAENKLQIEGRLYGVAPARRGIMIRTSHRLIFAQAS